VFAGGRASTTLCWIVLCLLVAAAPTSLAQPAGPDSLQSGWYDITRYGARGDGIADDTAAINAAVRALPPSGGILYIPPGSFRIGRTVVLRHGVSLRGAGMGISTLRQADGANLSSIVTYPASSFVTVSDLTFDGNKAKNTTRTDGLLNFDNSSDVIVRNCEFKDAVGHPTVGVALRFAGVNRRILIDGNYVHDAGALGSTPSDAIYVGGSSVRIVNNLVVGASDTGLVYEAVSISPGAPSDHAVIANNIIRNTPQGIAVDAAIADSSGATTVVNGNTIEDIKAVNGASIFVFKGSRGRSQVAVSVLGNVIRNSTDGHGIFLDGVSDVTVNGNVLNNMSLQKAKHGITVLRSNLVSIIGNTIRGVGGNGISLQGTTNITVTGNVIADVNMAGVGGVGIDVRDVPGVRSDSVVVVGNAVSGVKHQHGLQLADGATNLLALGNALGGAGGSINQATTGRVKLDLNLDSSARTPDASRTQDVVRGFSASIQWRPAQLLNGGVATTSVQIGSAAVGDGVLCSHDRLGSRLLLLACHVESSGVVRAVLLNLSGGSVEIPTGTLRVRIFRHSAP
jgi:pectate lyase-like protein/parallel beta helix pectate lyase-like protein